MQNSDLPDQAKPLATEVLLRLLAHWIKVGLNFQNASKIGREPEQSMGAVKALCTFARETNQLIIPDDNLASIITGLAELREGTSRLPSLYRQELSSLIDCLSARLTGKAQAQL